MEIDYMKLEEEKKKAGDKTLNLETFNDIVFKALRDRTARGRKALIEAELRMISDVLTQKMGLFVDECIEKGIESEILTELYNIRCNAEALLDELKLLDEEIAREENENATDNQ